MLSLLFHSACQTSPSFARKIAKCLFLYLSDWHLYNNKVVCFKRILDYLTRLEELKTTTCDVMISSNSHIFFNSNLGNDHMRCRNINVFPECIICQHYFERCKCNKSPSYDGIYYLTSFTSSFLSVVRISN